MTIDSVKQDLSLMIIEESPVESPVETGLGEGRGGPSHFVRHMKTKDNWERKRQEHNRSITRKHGRVVSPPRKSLLEHFLSFFVPHLTLPIVKVCVKTGDVTQYGH